MNTAIPHFTTERQIERLRQRGLWFEDIESARKLLAFISHHRMRSLVLLALGMVEVAVASSWEEHLEREYGPLGYTRSGIYWLDAPHGDIMDAVKKCFNVSDHPMVVRHRERHGGKKLPPISVAAQAITFGVLARCIMHLGDLKDRKSISRPSGLSQQNFISFLQLAVRTRNMCAHHAPLFNSRIPFELMLSRKARSRYGAVPERGHSTLYNTLATTDIILSRCRPEFGLGGEVAGLLRDYPEIDPKEMGFPAGWRDEPGWQAAQTDPAQAS